ncbi:hypothetical protein RJ639_025283 [Escallonia herrerae]|uniref:Methyltransferase type 11 domain-containing protein n=1 Tax=Escallonia herrerae TaxID=1293975 RepID=A0AA89ABM8_9ASTE|nr:hypothetical protein RJ639_025283 [Escallonia herrerae]
MDQTVHPLYKRPVVFKLCACLLVKFLRKIVVCVVMSEDMAKDGYEDIMNVDISSVAIDLMRRKYEHVPWLKYMQMDVKDMSFFPDETFDGVVDKGTLDSLMCGTDAPISAAQMLGEVSRLLKPGGIYMLITYGDPTVRMPHLSKPVYSWEIELYVIRKFLLVEPGGKRKLEQEDHRDFGPIEEVLSTVDKWVKWGQL